MALLIRIHSSIPTKWLAANNGSSTQKLAVGEVPKDGPESSEDAIEAVLILLFR